MAKKDKGKLVRATDIPVQVGEPTVEQTKRTVNTQIPYKNFAGLDENLDKKAASWVLSNRDKFRMAASGPMRRWGTNWRAANANVTWGEHQDDIHVPETKKMCDGKVARVEEAIASIRPPFEAKGTKGEISRQTAHVITSFTFGLMEGAKWQDLIQPVARDGELCNTLAVKVLWNHQIENKIERVDELKFRNDETPYHRTERRMKRSVQSGPRYCLVDPFWFLYDLTASTLDECSYVGDESFVFLHELEQQAEIGIYSKEVVGKLRDKTAVSGNKSTDRTVNSDYPDQYRKARSIANTHDQPDSGNENDPRRLRVIEMWGWFDFGKEGYEGVLDPFGQRLTKSQRVVITIANGTVIRFQQNPYDKKFSPYAFTRINRNGHEMMAPAPFDTVVQTNEQYDRFASNVMRGMDLNVSPLVMVRGGNSDLPDSIMDVMPGTVQKDAGDWDFLKMPDITQMAMFGISHFRREHEELSGSMRIHEQPLQTATETERKVQEQQRMIRASIRANAELWRQVALLTYWMAAQFSTGPQQFSVVGKSQSVLRKQFTITPKILQEDVDFEFIGLADLHTFGDRKAGFANVMNRWGAILPNMPRVNIQRLFQMDFEESVGRSMVDEIFPESDPSWESWPQSEENVQILAGQNVPTHPDDDDEKHIQETVVLVKNPKTPKYIKKIAMEHIQQHLVQMAKKEAEMAAERQEAQRKAMLQAPQGGQPGQDRPPAGGGMPAQSKPGQTPGPPQDRAQSRSGRQPAGPSQSQAMSA